MDQSPFNEILAGRYYSLPDAERDALDELVWELRPFHWPGQIIVDFDNLGDGSAWLDDNLGERPAAILLGAADEGTGALAEEYVSVITKNGGALPSAFGEESDGLDDLASVQSDFRRFFAAWREKAIPLLLNHLGGPPVNKP